MLATPVRSVINFVKLNMHSPVTTVFTIDKENNKHHFKIVDGGLEIERAGVRQGQALVVVICHHQKGIKVFFKD